MADERYLTREGAEELRRELDELIRVKRPALAQRLKEAIAQGDLSENADYHDAKEQQAFLEGRIRYLETTLRTATIIDGSSDGPDGTVRVGMQVTLESKDEPDETYTIVGAAEANPREGKISHESPLGAALMGRKVGDRVSIDAPAGKLTFRIKAIR